MKLSLLEYFTHITNTRAITYESVNWKMIDIRSYFTPCENDSVANVVADLTHFLCKVFINTYFLWLYYFFSLFFFSYFFKEYCFVVHACNFNNTFIFISREKKSKKPLKLILWIYDSIMLTFI